MDLGLKGKVAMVAGASRGLGFAVARGLAGEGATVSMGSRDAAKIADVGQPHRSGDLGPHARQRPSMFGRRTR